jgi:hypothetical protein
MKKWMYVIFPGLMLAGFLVIYTTHKKAADERERVREQKIAADLEADKEKKKKAEEMAAADAEKRRVEREAEDRKKEEERQRKKAAIDKDILDETNKYIAEADRSAKESANLEIELDRLHKQKDQLNRDDFALAKEIEMGRVAKQTAELKQQHLTAMIAQKAGNSSMASMPPPPPAPKK